MVLVFETQCRFIYSFMAIGILVCIVTVIGFIAAEAINGCCLCFVSFFYIYTSFIHLCEKYISKFNSLICLSVFSIQSSKLLSSYLKQLSLDSLPLTVTGRRLVSLLQHSKYCILRLSFCAETVSCVSFRIFRMIQLENSLAFELSLKQTSIFANGLGLVW